MYKKLDQDSEIEGVLLKELDCFDDDRGIFTNVEKPFEVTRSYFVSNFSKGTVRAFHGHKKEKKAFTVIKGAAKFIVVDNRKKSPTYKKYKEFVLSYQKPKLLVIPEDCYNGFCSLTDDMTVVCFSSSSMKESMGDDFRLSPSVLGKDIWKVQHR